MSHRRAPPVPPGGRRARANELEQLRRRSGPVCLREVLGRRCEEVGLVEIPVREACGLLVEHGVLFLEHFTDVQRKGNRVGAP
jgi:hypothetical protein